MVTTLLPRAHVCVCVCVSCRDAPSQVRCRVVARTRVFVLSATCCCFSAQPRGAGRAGCDAVSLRERTHVLVESLIK